MSKLLSRVRRSAAIGATAVFMAAGGVFGVAGPARADEPGLACTATARGRLTAPSPVRFGQFITVQWTTSAPDCPGPVFWITGPGFSGNQPLSGSRQFRVEVPGTTATWTMFILDTQTDSRPVAQIGGLTITVL